MSQKKEITTIQLIPIDDGRTLILYADSAATTKLAARKVDEAEFTAFCIESNCTATIFLAEGVPQKVVMNYRPLAYRLDWKNEEYPFGC